jgi:hypothetical protein
VLSCENLFALKIDNDIKIAWPGRWRQHKTAKICFRGFVLTPAAGACYFDVVINFQGKQVFT